MKQTTAGDFEVEVKRASGPVLVDFFTNRCPPCVQVAFLLGEIEAEKDQLSRSSKVDAEAAVAGGVKMEKNWRFEIPLCFRLAERLAAGMRNLEEQCCWFTFVS